MKTSSRIGLSILAGGLSFVGTANAVDLLLNGSFETVTGGTSAYNCHTDGTETGWDGNVSCMNYSFAYFAGPAIPSSEGPGSVYSWLHQSAVGAYLLFTTPTNEAAFLQYDLQYALKQTVNLTNAVNAAAIDAGQGAYTFSSWLASYTLDPEQPYLVLRFFDSTGTNQVGGNVIFDRTTSNFWVGNADSNDTTPPDGSNHMWSKFLTSGTVPTSARKATVYITRSPNAGVGGRHDTYTDLVKLNVINANDTTALESASPANNATNISPAVVTSVGLRDISTAVNTNTIQFSFDGLTVTPAIQKSGTLTTIQYDPPGLLTSLSSHTYRIVWSDNGGPVITKTNQFQFTVRPYISINLGPPIYLETFNSVAEGALPAGWSVSSSTDSDVPGNDLNNFHSDSYTNWVVISRSTASNLASVVPGGPDYLSIFNVAADQFINNALVTNLIETNFIFAASADRFGSQIQYVFTGDYNLSGRTNVYLSFHNIYIQNQNSSAAVEYSINGGTTWLPALYLLDGPDILLTGTGNIDASNTMVIAHADVPPPNNYGAFIGVAQSQWANLAPYLSARINDDSSESHRVEVVRLPQADNQSVVRFRLVQEGTNSWYFGIDDFGLYSITVTNPPLLSSSPTSQTVAVGNSVTFTVASASSIGPITYQWRRDGANIAGQTSQILTIPNAQFTNAGVYDVVVSNPGGSVTSAPPATLTVINPAMFVTGQWDFNGTLAASCGQDLQYYDASVQANTTFGTTTSFGISDIGGQPASVMKLTPTSGNSESPGANDSTDAWGGYRMFHGASPNGGGTNVNQYTVIFDILYPGAANSSWRALLEADTTATTGGDDSEYYISPGNGIGISSIYQGTVTSDVWHRIALAVDLSGPGTHPVVAKFIDGVKVGEQTGGLSLPDGRFSLPSQALLLAENNGYNNDAYVSSVQFSNGRRPDAFLAALGGPSVSKIPGCITARLQGSSIIIRWTGGVTLQSADQITGPWSDVLGASSPYTVPSPAAKKFYRPKLP